MMIFLVLTEVLGQFGYSCRQQRNLDFGGTRIALTTPVIRYDFRFRLTGK
jgi:hypothetical protein